MFKLRINLKFFFIFIIVLFLKIIHGGYIVNLLYYLQLTVIFISTISIIVNYLTLELNVKTLNFITTTNNNFYFSIEIKNNGPIACNFVTVQNSTVSNLIEKYNGEVLSISGFSSKKVKYYINLKQRGIYDLGTFGVELSDLFSIISIKRNIKKDYLLKVYPQSVNISRYSGNGNDVIYEKDTNIGYREGNSSIKDIRRYIPGDSLKKINWKLTAKANEFMVKNYENIDGNEMNIFLDMNKLNYKKDKDGQLEETLIDIVASLIQHANKDNVDVKLWCNNKEATYHRFNYENIEDSFEFFIERKSDGTICFDNFVKDQIDSIPIGSIITIIAISRNEEIDRIEKYILDLKCIPNIICVEGNIDKDSICVDEFGELAEGGR